jgi:hypothetical protein
MASCCCVLLFDLIGDIKTIILCIYLINTTSWLLCYHDNAKEMFSDIATRVSISIIHAPKHDNTRQVLREANLYGTYHLIQSIVHCAV